MNLIRTFLFTFLILIGIHRIDLASGALSFILLPALVASIISIAFLALLLFYGRNLRINKIMLLFIFLQILYCCWILITIIGYKDIIQVKRVVLFCIIQISTAAFIIMFYQLKDKIIFLKKFLNTSFDIYFCFSLIQAIYFIFGKFGDSFNEPFTFLTLQPRTISYYFPRLTGGFIDPNVGGFFLTFIFLLFKHFKIEGIRSKIIPVLIFATLSRGAIGAFLVVLLIKKVYPYLVSYDFFKVRVKFKRKMLNRVLLSIAILFTSVYVLLHKTNFFDKLVAGVQARLFNKDNSTSIHLSLIETAIGWIFNDVLHFIVGYGFSSSFLYTQEFFPNEKHGNFHSELLTIFFETGLIGFLLYVAFFLIPIIILFHKKRFIPNINLFLIIIAALLQGIFYQQFLFNYYWIVLSLVWLLPFVNDNYSMEQERLNFYNGKS